MRIVLLTLMLPGLGVVSWISADPAEGFGTVNILGQRAEHERITRAALACQPGAQAAPGECFEPQSMDQLAGRTGTFGAVGAPDIPFTSDSSNPAAHCDDADFLNAPGYPQTRAQANMQLLACIKHLRGRFAEGINAAAGLFDAAGNLIESQVSIVPDCIFMGGVPGRAKCNAIEGFGRALHGVQDFYSHSNWADEADPAKPLGITNPPGLNRPGPSPLFELRASQPAADSSAIPPILSTGFFAGPFSDNCPGNTRITHACLNKDKVLIDPVTGATSDPRTPRGQVLSNARKAVEGAIADTRRQWADFRDQLIKTYGPEKGARAIEALTKDAP